VKQATKEWQRFATILDGHLHDRRWLVGNGLTVADFAVASVLPYAERASIPLDEFPNVRRWHDRLNELDAWREPYPALSEAA
jgi:glutathione S-transferase